MEGAVFLEGEKVNLRTFEREHLKEIQKTYNDPRIRKFLSHDRPANMEQEEDFFENIVCNEESVNLVITSGEDIVGSISLEPSEKDIGTAEIGLFIAPETQQKGYGTEASELLISHAFNELRYHKLIARVYETNKPSRKLWEKLGFEKEGELRDQNFTGGEYENVIIYGLVEEEWQE